MKKKYIYLLVACLFGLSSCEDFLDKREDTGNIEESAIYESYESIRGYLDNVYGSLENYIFCTKRLGKVSDASGDYERTYLGVMADEMGTTWNKTTLQKFFSGDWLLTEKNAQVAEIGNGSATPIGKTYEPLRIVNRIIANIDQVPMSESQRGEILGQAYFFRAWFYFQMIKRYGGMMLIDKVYAESTEADVPRLSYHESSDWMVSDLDQAISMLPDRWDDTQYTRPTKLAAMAFKAMALLYDASPLMQNGLDELPSVKSYDKERAAKAAKAAWEAINYMENNVGNTGVRLATADEYKNIFYYPENEQRRVEHIWLRRITFSNATDRSNTIRAYWQIADMHGSTGEESMCQSYPTWNAVQMYERKGPDGNYYPITDSRSGYVFNEDSYDITFSDRDPRFYNNILVCGEEFGTYKSGLPYYIRLWEGCQMVNEYENNQHTNTRNYGGFVCKKFFWPEANAKHTGSTSGNTTYCGNIFQTVFIRASQLYLDFAEASFEATGSATATVQGCGMTAEQALNKIRNRIGVTNIVSDIVNDPNKFREAYRRERGVELMFENQRWWDVRRWMIMHELFKENAPLKMVKFYPVGDYKDGAVKGGTDLTRPETFRMEEVSLDKEVRNFSNMRNYWYPLPQHDVDALQNLQQNPGW